MDSNASKNVIRQRILVTFFIILTYVIGRHILIPGVDVKQVLSMGDNQILFKFVTGMTGGDLGTLSFFSLGLGPWMSTLIIWRVLTIFKNLELDKITQKKSYRLKMVFTVIIAFIQSLTVSSSLSLQRNLVIFGENQVLKIVILALIMVTGTLFLVWLSNMNESFGVGGAVIIILIGILLPVPQSVLTYFRPILGMGIEINDVVQIVVILIAIVILVRISIQMQGAELRLPIRNVLGSGGVSSKSYLPILVNPAGGFPLMYSMSVSILPQYSLQLLNLIWPGNKLTYELINNTSLSSPIGVTLYILVLGILSIGFAFVNVDPETISRDLQRTGDYIENVEPGVATRNFVKGKVLLLSTVGTFYLCMISGMPLYIGTEYSNFTQYGLSAGSVIILVSLCRNVYDQVYALIIKNNYSTLIDIKEAD